MSRWRARTRGPAETRALGEALGRTAPDGAVLLLEGPLGAGKTALAQGVAAGCGVTGAVASPTYNLILHYRGERPFTHVDLYRLEDEAALATLDLDEILDAGGVTCVEWPGLLERLAPPFGEIRLRPEGGDHRDVRGVLTGPGWEAAESALSELGAEVG